MKRFVAYQGQKFTIEWYFDDRGKSDSLEYYKEIPFDQKKKIFKLFRIFGEMGKILNTEKFRYEGDKIYTFKASPNRFLCFFFEGKKIIVTSAYKKQSAKMPTKEKQKALKSKKDYVKRYKAGNYYE